MKRVSGLIAVLVFWELGARHLDSLFFPPVTVIVPALGRLVVSGEAWIHARESLWRITMGFLLASAVGIVGGVIVTQSRSLSVVLMPVVDAVRPIAALTIFPLLILLLGLGNASKVAVIFWTAWPAVLLNTAEGLRRVSQDAVEAAALDGAGRWATLRWVRFPLALPAIVTGLRIGLSGGWISLVSAEMLGSSRGLGFSILAYSQTFRFAEMYAVVVEIAALGLAMNVVLAQVQQLTDLRLGVERKVGSEYVSPFVRYLDRAVSWNIDSLRLGLGRRGRDTTGHSLR